MDWLAMIVAAGISATSSSQPLRLEVSQSGEQLLIRLVGESPVATSARYELEVTGGAAGARNRSVQRGTAAIRPGQTVTVATLRLRNAKDATWTANLHVAPMSSSAYDLKWTSKP